MRFLTLGPLTRVLVSLLAALLLLGVAGCGESSDTDTAPVDAESQAALQGFVDELGPQVAAEIERYDDVYGDFELRAEGSSTLVYEYTFLEEVDPADAEEQLEATQKLLTSMAGPIMEELEEGGVNDPRVRWLYLNPDGSEVFQVEHP